MNKKLAKEIIGGLALCYPNATAQLKWTTPFELLVAVILSAQCTDARVNVVTAQLFKEYNTPEKMIELSQEELEIKIKSCGLYRAKAKNILSASRSICENFNGQVPSEFSQLTSLAGVGRKTANVVASVAFCQDAIAVDTHVFRLAHRLGFSTAKTPIGVEKDLCKYIEKSLWSKSHHYLIFHGRKVCKAIKPKCSTCKINGLCKKIAVKNFE